MIQTICQGLFPNHCLLCLTLTHSDLALCSTCIELLPWREGTQCEICTEPLPQTSICGQCLQNLPAFSRVISPLRYEPPIDRFLTQLKFNRKLIYAHMLGSLFAQYLLRQKLRPLPQAIFPVPLHIKRLRQRGYNQATEICKPIAKRLKLPCHQEFLVRDKYTEAQAQLNANERENNVKNAFQVKRPIPFSHVAIVDDVMTTGATLRQLCGTIQQSGVEKIEVWCVARNEKSKQ